MPACPSIYWHTSWQLPKRYVYIAARILFTQSQGLVGECRYEKKSPDFGIHLYTREAQEELLGLFHRAVLDSAPPAAAEVFTMERLREEFTIGVIVWYEIQVGAGVTVLSDPNLGPEKVEFFRHVMARNKLMVEVLRADKFLHRLSEQEPSSVPEHKLEPRNCLP